MNKALIAAVVIIVVLGGGFFLLNSDSELNTSDTSQSGSGETSQTENQSGSSSSDEVMTDGTVHEMILGEDGYEPKNITIKKGDVIEFSTTQDRPFWPASNIHPTHGIYPEFDPQDAISPGETWSFRFDNVGEWNYHDHLAPYITGAITVTE